MKPGGSVKGNWLINAGEVYGIGPASARVIVLLPILMTMLYSLLFFPNVTGLWLESITEENGPVELLTFAFLILGAILGLRLAFRARQNGENFLVVGFYVFFSLVLFIVGMEEVAWGQWLFGFVPPEALTRYNVKGEMTLHNIEGFDSRTDILRVLFGVGGIVGVLLANFERFWKIAAPSMLLPWFICITLPAFVDLYDDFYFLPEILTRLNHYLAEVVELMIGMSATLYIFLNDRMLGSMWKTSR